MQKIVITLAVLIGSCGLAAAQSPAPTAGAPTGAAPTGNAANGQKLFMADGCYQCHGTVGQGSRGTGPRLAPNPVPYEGFAQQVRKPANTMPPYTALVLSEAQLADIYAYVSSLPGPAKPEDVTILH
jgi:mono/diheme cytochrome c family protein